MLAWIIFAFIVIALLTLDLGVLRRNAQEMTLRQAILWSCAWIFAALLFNAGIYYFNGPEDGLNFLTGYLLEKSLSMDNLFIFVAVFATFNIPKTATHKVLFWGIFGALVMRALFIALGLSLVHHFSWIFYLFGILLILSGLQIGFGKENKGKSQGKILQWFTKWIPVTSDPSTHTFFVHTAQGWFATPLLLALLAIELSDVIFALDSIPAIFAITRDPFIVYTSNIFAILGMRSLYFVLAHAWDLFDHLNIGIAMILVMIGLKMLLESYITIPNGIILALIFVIMGGCIWTSLQQKKHNP